MLSIGTFYKAFDNINCSKVFHQYNLRDFRLYFSDLIYTQQIDLQYCYDLNFKKTSDVLEPCTCDIKL